MMIFYIVTNPEVEKKVRKEIETEMNGEDYSFETLKKLKYIDLIQKETTRLYGPSPGLFIREASQDHLLCGVPIPKGALINPIWAGNHWSSEYFPDPFVFRPERW